MSQSNLLVADGPEVTFSDYLTEKQRLIHEALEGLFRPPRERVVEAACYSLLLPSKRLRPLFCLETCRAFLGEDKRALAPAVALEMVHTYSLIHDDLPSMDDDDLRRGKPTNHKVYGEATAILAGDGLLTFAFETLASTGDASPEVRVRWVKELAQAAGMAGMVLGQDWDMSFTRQSSLKIFENLHRKKTGALLAASVVMGAATAEISEEIIEQLRQFALDMGLAFQIRDDVLDVEGGAEIGKPLRSDERNAKGTYVSVLGLEGAKREGEAWYQRAMDRLHSIRFPYENRLEELTKFVIDRKK